MARVLTLTIYHRTFKSSSHRSTPQDQVPKKEALMTNQVRVSTRLTNSRSHLSDLSQSPSLRQNWGISKTLLIIYLSTRSPSRPGEPKTSNQSQWRKNWKFLLLTKMEASERPRLPWENQGKRVLTSSDSLTIERVFVWLPLGSQGEKRQTTRSSWNDFKQ